MVIDDIIDAVGYLYNNLQTFINYCTKDIQVLIDSIHDPADDNEHEIFAIPPQFYATFYKYDRAKKFTHAYDSWEYGNGNQPFVFCGTIKLENNVLELLNVFCLEKQYTGAWTFLDSTQISECENFVRNYPLEFSVYSDYPDKDTVIHYYGGDRFSFEPDGYSVSNVGYEYDDVNGGHSVSPINFDFMSGDFYYSHDVYIDYDFALYTLDSSEFRGLYGQPFMMVSSDLTAITTYITNNDAVNNYSEQITSGDGDPFTVYYGDNYIIYYIPAGNKLSYDDIYLTTQNITNIIVRDNPSMQPIHVPSYRENKYGPEVDYTDDNFGLTTTGFSSNIGGAGNYWLMDLATLAGFISDFKTTAPAGSMISQNILSCYVNALNYEWETGNDNIVIHAAGSQNTPYTSTKQYDYIYQYNPHIVVGQYKVPRVTETFYDFNPYSTYELYIPFCGWIGLPDTVAGRNIRVYMDFDVATMSCKAYVMVEMKDGSGGTICGEITGSFGAPCPVQVIEGGLYKQAMINSGLQIASGVVSGLMGGAFGGPVGVSMLAEGGMNAVQGLASAYMAGNTNYGQTIGRAGDTSGLCGGHYCYIKITHPVIDEVVDSVTFGHTTGYPCYMESELSELAGTGFTVCLNPHVHVNCTQSEKEEIKRLLETGVIL